MRNNQIDLLLDLEAMSSAQLSSLLQTETAKPEPNDDFVMLILDILEKRDGKRPVELGPSATAAWDKYQMKAKSRGQGMSIRWRPLLQVASVALTIVLLCTMLPQRVEADRWWERLAKWSDDFFAYFSSGSEELKEEEYTFQTDNPGLQQIYDAVVEMGVTKPVVPMWLPGGYELVEIETVVMPTHSFVLARLKSGISEIVIQVMKIILSNQMHILKMALSLRCMSVAE